MFCNSQARQGSAFKRGYLYHPYTPQQRQSPWKLESDSKAGRSEKDDSMVIYMTGLSTKDLEKKLYDFILNFEVAQI